MEKHSLPYVSELAFSVSSEGNSSSLTLKIDGRGTMEITFGSSTWTFKHPSPAYVTFKHSGTVSIKVEE